VPLKDLLEESPEHYDEEDFYDLGVSSTEAFPAVTAGNRAP
jgi:hypothetical protein